MRCLRYIILLFMPLLWACFEDKGNYDYEDLGDVVIENVPELIEALSGADRIQVTPKIISTLEGEINDNNPNYEFVYKFDKTSGSLNGNWSEPWVILNPEGNMNLDTLANFPAGSYICYLSVKDIRTGIETIKTFNVKISSSVYEGWMVLCNEGEENRIRMDMISRISAERMVAMHDLLTGLGLPEGHNATQIAFAPSMYYGKEAIYVMGETGSYKIDAETFTSGASWNMKATDFIMSPDDEPICFAALNNGLFVDNTNRFCVTTAGNVYAITSSTSGAAFELPINTSTRGGAVEYKVAPYIGISMLRPGNANCALMYDVDNLRFVGWAYSQNADALQTMSPLEEPTGNKLFSYNTGKELIHMESTSFSGGVVYSILQDKNGERSIYAINAGGTNFTQESYYEKLNAPDFKQATEFAFHSQFPFMFYAVKNKVYLYDLGTGTNYPLEGIKLGENEEVTMLKFNLYQQPSLDYLSDTSEEFLGKQYNLIVGSYDNAVTGVNGGKVGFYKIDRSSHSVTKLEEYDGFAKVKDVVYRERRK